MRTCGKLSHKMGCECDLKTADEVKPCPFCGAAAEWLNDTTFVWCPNNRCFCDQAITLEQWNNRPPVEQRPSYSEEQVKSLVEAAQELRGSAVILVGRLESEGYDAQARDHKRRIRRYDKALPTTQSETAKGETA